MTTAVEYVAGLRALADWIEANPEQPLSETILSVWCQRDTKEAAAAVMRAFGSCEKEYGDSCFYLKKAFGPITLRFVFLRAAVCTRRVVGTKHVPAQFYPEREEEIVKWDCHPILASEETSP